MAAGITNDVLEGYVNCQHKGYLKLAGEHGIRSDYEALLAEQRAEVRLRAIDKILARHGEDQVARHVPLTAATLKGGPLFVLDAALEDEVISLHFDGLKRVGGASKLGGFHYVPVVFHEAEQVRKGQRLLLEAHALLLSRVQGRMPGCGIVWHGKGCRATKVRLGTDPRKAEKVLRDLQELRGGEPPRICWRSRRTCSAFRGSVPKRTFVARHSLPYHTIAQPGIRPCTRDRRRACASSRSRRPFRTCSASWKSTGT